MDVNRLHLLRVIGAGFLYLQGILVFAWWAGIGLSPGFRSSFLWPGVSAGVLGAFFGPDIVLYGAGSLVTAYGLSNSRPWAPSVAMFVAGAVVAEEGLAVAISFMTGGGWLGAAVMLPSAVVTVGLARGARALEKRHDAFRD